MMGSTAKSWTKDPNRGSLCSAPGLREIFPKITQTVPLSLCCKAYLFCLSSLQTIMEPAILQFSTNPSGYQFCISSSYHHNPFSFLKSFSCKLTQHFCLPVRPLSVLEDNGQWDNPAAVSSCAAWQSSLQPAAPCSVLSGYNHCHWHRGAEPFPVSTEHIQKVTVKSQKWTHWLQGMLHLGFKP